MKKQKFRTFVKAILLVVSLFLTGLSTSLTVGIRDSILNSFGTIIDTNTITLNKKPCKNQVFSYNSCSKSDVITLINTYDSYLDYYGCNYVFDFENSFPDANELYLNSRGRLKRMPGFNIRMFNEFIYTNNFEDYETYPKLDCKLKLDEVVLSIDYEQMKEMCLQFQILRTFSSLGEYIENNDVYLTLRLINYSWQYSDEQIFKLKGVIFDSQSRVFHTNNLFNENLFETNMRLPVSFTPLKQEKYPWILKKYFYVHTKSFQTYFLNKIFYDYNRENYIFDSDNKSYSPLNCAYDTKITNRVYVFNSIKDTIEVDMINQVKNIGFDYESYYFSSQSGYYNNGTSIFSGFSKRVFFSADLKNNEEIIDAYSKVNEKEFNNLKIPDGVVDGYALKTNSSNLRLKVYKEDSDLKPNEIVISKGFLKTLNCTKDIIDQDIYVTLLKNSSFKNGKVINNFSTIKLVVKGIVENDNSNSIYQNSDFSISFFRDLFKVSSFELIPCSIIFETKKSLKLDEINKFNKYFSNYEFSNPLYSIEDSINESTKFLRYILLAFSALSIFSSCVLLLIITSINAIEQRKDVAILKVLGFSDKQVMKMFFIDNLTGCLIGFIGSSVVLGLVSLIGEKLFRMTIGLENLILFSPLSLLFNLILIIILAFVGTLGAKKEISNIKLVDEVH